jgi:hypothetical protein
MFFYQKGKVQNKYLLSLAETQKVQNKNFYSQFRNQMNVKFMLTDEFLRDFAQRNLGFCK